MGKKRLPSPLVMEPFPPLKLRDDTWTGRDTLETWAGSFQNRKGAVDVEVSPPEDADDVSRVPPLPEQVAAYQYLKKNEASVTKAILAAVFKDYPDLRKEFQADEVAQEKGGFWMPPVRSQDGLKELIGPWGLTVMSYAKEDIAYLGVAMRCSWHVEHGLGVMMHKSRVLKIGGADCSFDPFVTTDDGGEELSEP